MMNNRPVDRDKVGKALMVVGTGAMIAGLLVTATVVLVAVITIWLKGLL